jgi:hypothetical protein
MVCLDDDLKISLSLSLGAAGIVAHVCVSLPQNGGAWYGRVCRPLSLTGRLSDIGCAWYA